MNPRTKISLNIKIFLVQKAQKIKETRRIQSINEMNKFKLTWLSAEINKNNSQKVLIFGESSSHFLMGYKKSELILK